MLLLVIVRSMGFFEKEQREQRCTAKVGNPSESIDLERNRPLEASPGSPF